MLFKNVKIERERNQWSRFPDSNWGPTVYKTVALPTELKRQLFMIQRLLSPIAPMAINIIISLK